MAKFNNSKSANAYAPWDKTQPSRMLRSSHTSWSLMREYLSKSSCQSTRWDNWVQSIESFSQISFRFRRFRNSAQEILPTISPKGCVTSTRTQAVSFHLPNFVICWQLSVRSWATKKSSSWWTTKRTLKAMWTTKSSSGWSWMVKPFVLISPTNYFLFV